jgi:hypothetical protein
MASLQDLINLAKADGGKFFVIDETGDAKLVIMSVEEYQKLLLGKLQKQILDVEKINREIIRAQMGENADKDNAVYQNKSVRPLPNPPQAWGGDKTGIPLVDLRAEVIDPSFDFEDPKTDLEDL